jgi:phosphomannomutase
MGLWFGSSGIRGSYDTISPEFGFNLGIAVGRAFSLNNPAYIASDIRATGDILKSAFMSGYSSVSKDIIDLGLCPTPIPSYLSAAKETLGIMITASHNPPSHNGFKLFWKGGECSEIIEESVERYLVELYQPQKPISNNLKPWISVGRCKNTSSERIIDEYIDYIQKNVKISYTNLNIVIDCANNVPNLVTPLVLKKLGISQVTAINKDLDHTFPGRPSEPTKENLKGLIKTVINKEADIGIAHDGDGDRFAIIDDEGNMIAATTMINFFIDHLDYSDVDSKLIYLTSDCTSEAAKIAQNRDANVKISRIGKNKEYVNEQGVLFLAEPNKLVFPKFGKWIDGLFPVLKLLEIVRDQKISYVMKQYENRRILRKAFNVSEDKKSITEEKIALFPSLWSERILKIDQIDGLKLYLKDDSSVLIRFSGTEPKVKFYLESDSDTQNKNLLSTIKKELNLIGEGVDC